MENTELSEHLVKTNPFAALEKLFLFIQKNPGAEKISFNSLEKDMHYTIRYWSRKKTVDLHKTNQLTGEHTTIFEISTFKLLRLMMNFGMVQEYLTKEIWLGHKINPGKLKRNNCWLTDLDNKNEMYKDIVNINKTRMRLKKGLNILDMAKNIEFFSPDILKYQNEGTFMVFKYKGGNLIYQGLVYKFTALKGNYFLTQQDYNLTSKLSMIAIYNLTAQITFDKKEEVLAALKTILSKKYKYLRWVENK